MPPKRNVAGKPSETDTIVSFRGSDVAYGTCTLNQLYFDNLCFKIIGDPEYLQSGILTTTFTPDDRVGPVDQRQEIERKAIARIQPQTLARRAIGKCEQIGIE